MASAAWIDIVSTTRSIAEQFRSEGSVAWYRGERDATWTLRSTLHRHLERTIEGWRDPLTEAERIKMLRDVAKTLYRVFKSEAWPLLADRERSDWGVLFAMQHFSIPTRLLDWTESFGCAVFFAQLRRRLGDAASIWVLDPQALNELSIGSAGVVSLDEGMSDPPNFDTTPWHPRWTPPTDSLGTIAVAPIYTNSRMVQQQSRFTLMGDSSLPLDEQLNGGLIRSERLRKLVLPPDTFADAEEFLSAAGLNAFSFYPDLEGLALKHVQQVDRDIRDARKYFPGVT
jgi:FRG domain